MLALPLVACVTEAEDIWFPPTPAGGKTDAVTRLSGSIIPSGYVNPNATYLSDRAIGSLVEVGALDDVLGEVAYRVDGIIANLPADGRIDVAELVRMEQPSFFATLFPAEQAAFPQLWLLLELPSSPTTVVPFSTTSLNTVDLAVTPGGLAFPPSELISSLPVSQQTAARRLQLVVNGDGNQATISFADLAAALMDPSRFTPADVGSFEAIRAELHRRGISNANARIRVEAPGTRTTTANLGQLSLTIRDSTSYVETRTFNGGYSGGWTVQLEAHQSAVATATLPSGTFAILIREDDGSELVVSSERSPSTLANATYIVEEWQQGARVANRDAHVTGFLSSTGYADLTPYVEYDLVTATMPLVRNLESAQTMYSNVVGIANRAIAVFNYAATTSQPTGVVETTALREVASVGITIPAGRYELATPNLGTVALDIYPQGVVSITIGGVTRRLVHTQLDGTHKLDSTFTGGPRAVFDPSTNILWIATQDGFAPTLTTLVADQIRVK